MNALTKTLLLALVIAGCRMTHSNRASEVSSQGGPKDPMPVALAGVFVVKEDNKSAAIEFTIEFDKNNPTKALWNTKLNNKQNTFGSELFADENIVLSKVDSKVEGLHFVSDDKNIRVIFLQEPFESIDNIYYFGMYSKNIRMNSNMHSLLWKNL